MNAAFDPYYHWLGIPAEEQPPDHYRLMGVRTFESDPEVLSNAADRQMLHVRSFQTGPRSTECQRLLNELAAARTCLLDPARKAIYDQNLASGLQSVRRPSPVISAPVLAPLGAGDGANAAAPASFERTGSSSSLRKRRSGGTQRSPLMVGVQIVGGGIAGVTLAWAVLWYGFGADPLGVMSDAAKATPVADATPADNEEDRPGAQSVSSNDRTSTVPARPTLSSPTVAADASEAADVDRQMELDRDPKPSVASTSPETPPRVLSDLNQPPKSEKHAQPTAEQIREAMAALTDALGDDLAPGSSRDERLARLTRLRKLADDVAEEPHVLYVVLREAYLEAGNLRLYEDAGQIVDRLVSNFDVDEIAVRSKLLKDFAQVARLPAERTTIATAALNLAEQAQREEKFEAASDLAALAEGQAGKAGNTPLKTQARQRDAEYSRALRARQAYEKSLATLDGDPGDAGANATVGRYLALLKGDFERAIPHLEKSDDPRLQPIAQRDAVGAASPDDQMTMADAWFELAASDTELAPLYARARHWYQRAEQGATGLVAVRIHSRLDQIDQAEKSGAFVDRSRPAPPAAATPVASNSASGSSTSRTPASRNSSPPPTSTPPPNAPFPPGPPFASGPPFPGAPPSGVMPPAAYDRVNQLAPTTWRAVLPQRDSRQTVQHASISIMNDDGVVTVTKERSPEFDSIHLINEIPMLPEFTARLRVRFPKANSVGGGTRIPYLGLRSVDGRSQTYVHIDSFSGEGLIHDIVLTRRGGAVNVTWDGKPKRVYDDNNLVPAQIYFHLNDDAELVIQSLVIEP